MKKIKVNLDKKVSTSHEIFIGYDVLDLITLAIAKNQASARHIIITDSNVAALYAAPVMEKLREAGLKVDTLEFPAGEESKNMTTVLSLVSALLALGCDRNSILLALGGGVTGDMTGFVASIFMRSIPYFQIPTTLMAQVDSSIGGKTAIDLPEGKNLLGTFFQPKGIFIDLKFLETLPEREFNNGLAEIIKYGLIEDITFFDYLEKNIEAIRKRDPVIIEKAVEHSCKTKKAIVEIDEREQGVRRILNFGHTIGHGIEAESDYAVTHGEAVAMGMVVAARLSERLHGFPKEELIRIEKLITAAGLVCSIPKNINTDGIISKMKMDKKKKDETINFVLLKKIGMPFINGGVPVDVLREVLEGLKK